jgi:hypothetical protein
MNQCYTGIRDFHQTSARYECGSKDSQSQFSKNERTDNETFSQKMEKFQTTTYKTVDSLAVLSLKLPVI